MKDGKWLNVAAVATWFICGIHPMFGIANTPFTFWPSGLWILCFLVYGAALVTFLCLPRLRPAFGPHVPALLAAVQSVTGLMMNYLSGNHWGGTGVGVGLLVMVAAELPYILPASRVWVWIGVQSVIMTAMFWRWEQSWATIVGSSVTFGIAMWGFQLFAAASSMLARKEQAARQDLAATNTELLGTRALLAEHSRAAERLRISRDLHDTLGHHLTALSLQLDVASRLSDGKAADHVRQAHAITRLLLADVRDVVSTLRDSSRIDVGQALRTLAIEQTGIAIHLDLPPVFTIDDPSRADTLVRCFQEVITNATRHSAAANLWIRIDSTPAGIAVHARDDGRGAESITCGNGLTGMRERFAEHAGHVEFTWARGAGFEVRGFLPAAAS